MTIKTKNSEIIIPKWLAFTMVSAIAGIFESLARISESRARK